MHVLIESSIASTIANVIEGLMKEEIPENSVLVVSWTKSSGHYKAKCAKNS